METASIELWHGSSHVIKHPEYGWFKPEQRLWPADSNARAASSWPRNGACAGMDDGFANRYTLTTDWGSSSWTCPSRLTPS